MTSNDEDQRAIAGSTLPERTNTATANGQDREIRRAALLLRLATIGKLSRNPRIR